jgi:hypothetical protein
MTLPRSRVAGHAGGRRWKRRGSRLQAGIDIIRIVGSEDRAQHLDEGATDAREIGQQHPP